MRFIRGWKLRPAHCGVFGVAALSVLVVALGGCQMRSTAASESAKAGPKVEISFCAVTPTECRSEASFSAAETRELAIHTLATGVAAGNHTQRLVIVMPNGGEYPATRIGFRVSPGENDAVPQSRTIEIAEMRATPKKITGSWTVRVILDDRLLATETFEMKP